MVFSTRSLVAATVKSYSISTVISRRCGAARSSSVTPMQNNTSRSTMLIRDMLLLFPSSTARFLFHDGPHQNTCRPVEGHPQCLCRGDPAELPRFIVQRDARAAGATAGEVEQNEMRVAIKFF